jgi:hypothetical protein
MGKFLLTFLLLPTLCFAQNKGDNTIFVKGITFEKVVNTLLDSGFTVDKIDKDFKTVKTQFKEHEKYTFTYYFDIRVKDSIAIIKGKWNSGGYVFDIQNIKGKSDQVIFSKMETYAKSLKGEISYSKQ